MVNIYLLSSSLSACRSRCLRRCDQTHIYSTSCILFTYLYINIINHVMCALNIIVWKSNCRACMLNLVRFKKLQKKQCTTPFRANNAIKYPYYQNLKVLSFAVVNSNCLSIIFNHVT